MATQIRVFGDAAFAARDPYLKFFDGSVNTEQLQSEYDALTVKIADLNNYKDELVGNFEIADTYVKESNLAQLQEGTFGPSNSDMETVLRSF